MSVATITAAAPEPDDHETPAQTARPQGIFAIPVVGPQLQRVRDFTEGLRPTEDDSTPVKVAKRAAQAGIVTTTAAVAAVAIL